MRLVGRSLLVGLLATLGGCGWDTDAEAPYLDPPTETGECASTEALFPRLRAFVGDGRYEPLREVVVARLQPSPDNPAPDPSWRSVVHALLALVEQLGLEEARIVATIAADPGVEDQLGPLLSVALQFVDGRLDGVPRYAPLEAAGFFVARCDAEHLLSSVEGVLRLESPSAGRPWAVAALEALGPLLEDPQLQPFLRSFEDGGASGRPAIVGLFRQIMAFLADEGFTIERVQTLVDSVVDPAVDAALEAKIDRLMTLFAEATDPRAGVLPPLQEAMRCGMRHPEPRDELLGFVFDLLVAPEVGLDRIVGGIEVLQLDVITSQLELLADTVRVLRTDPDVERELRAVLVLFLSAPDVQRVVPVLIGLLEEEILTELLAAVVTLLEGCGRAP